jgi:hypothetical protein
MVRWKLWLYRVLAAAGTIAAILYGLAVASEAKTRGSNESPRSVTHGPTSGLARTGPPRLPDL